MSDSNARGNEAKCNYKDHLTLCKIRPDCGENQRPLDGEEQNDMFNLHTHVADATNGLPLYRLQLL